jgi:hypothetical protein
VLPASFGSGAIPFFPRVLADRPRFDGVSTRGIFGALAMTLKAI